MNRLNLLVIPFIVLILDATSIWGKETDSGTDEAFNQISIGSVYLRRQSFQSLTFEHMILGKSEIGVDIFYRQSYLDGQIRNIGGLLTEHYYSYSNFSGDIHFNYFPLNGIFFLSPKLGLYPDGSEKFVYHDLIVPSQGNTFLTHPTVTFSYDLKNNYYLVVPVGWMFSIGSAFRVRIELGLNYDLAYRVKAYVYSDNRGFFPGTEVPSIYQIWYLQSKAPSSTYNVEPIRFWPFVLISFGIRI